MILFASISQNVDLSLLEAWNEQEIYIVVFLEELVVRLAAQGTSYSVDILRIIFIEFYLAHEISRYRLRLDFEVMLQLEKLVNSRVPMHSLFDYSGVVSINYKNIPILNNIVVVELQLKHCSNRTFDPRL